MSDDDDEKDHVEFDMEEMEEKDQRDVQMEENSDDGDETNGGPTTRSFAGDHSMGSERASRERNDNSCFFQGPASPINLCGTRFGEGGENGRKDEDADNAGAEEEAVPNDDKRDENQQASPGNNGGESGGDDKNNTGGEEETLPKEQNLDGIQRSFTNVGGTLAEKEAALNAMMASLRAEMREENASAANSGAYVDPPISNETNPRADDVPEGQNHDKGEESELNAEEVTTSERTRNTPSTSHGPPDDQAGQHTPFQGGVANEAGAGVDSSAPG